MAKRMVKAFGKDTLEIIEKEIDRLIEVEGIGGKRVEMIRRLGGAEGDPRGHALSPRSRSKLWIRRQDLQAIR
jgi:hypothetical protein